MTHSVARNEIVVVENIPAHGAHVEIEAGEAERALIARRLEVPGLIRLKGAFDIARRLGGIDMAARIDAVVQRECVVSLEVFDEAISRTFEINFTHDEGDETEVEIDEATPEPLQGDVIDLGEILVQQLALEMDPYPRKPGAPSLAEAYAPEKRVSPFAALKTAIGKPRDGE
ncbi:MAG: DUF177 domain-containing protein [Parvularculaceae bacterium]